MALAMTLFVILIIWSAIWKGIALWNAGKNRQLAWFVVMFILNTAGILPIIYLLFFKKKERKIVRIAPKPVKRRIRKKTAPKRRKRRR
jgi:methionyl-tRNA synthetase